MAFRVFLDANVLVPNRPRDVLLALADAGLFAPYWSSDVLTEMVRHLPESMDDASREAVVRHMNAAFPEALTSVPVNFRGVLSESINEKDQHIIDAAFLSKAELVVTADRRLRAEIEELPWLDAQDVPEFVAYTIDAEIVRARAALVKMARSRWLEQGSKTSDESVIERLRTYFVKVGWSPEGL